MGLKDVFVFGVFVVCWKRFCCGSLKASHYKHLIMVFQTLNMVNEGITY